MTALVPEAADSAPSPVVRRHRAHRLARSFSQFQGLCKEIPVFADLECSNARSEYFNTVLLENAHFIHLDSQIKPCLATKGEQYAIRPLALDNVGDIFRRDWEVVHFIGELVIRLDSCNIGIDQNRCYTGFFQSL